MPPSRMLLTMSMITNCRWGGSSVREPPGPPCRSEGGQSSPPTGAASSQATWRALPQTDYSLGGRTHPRSTGIFCIQMDFYASVNSLISATLPPLRTRFITGERITLRHLFVIGLRVEYLFLHFGGSVSQRAQRGCEADGVISMLMGREIHLIVYLMNCSCDCEVLLWKWNLV